MSAARTGATRPDQLSINTATLRESCNLRQAAEALRRHGIRGIAPWRDRVAEVGAREAGKIIRDNGLVVTGLCRGGMFPGNDAGALQAAIDDNRRAIDEAAEIGAHCLAIVSGGLPSGSKALPAARDMVRDGLAAIMEHARAARMPIAIEPLHPMYCADRSCINTLSQALDICEALDPRASGAIGVIVDIYHVWWDPELEDQIERAGEKRLLGFHICDWLVPTRDLLQDRGMMGDGVIDIARIRGAMEAAGYRGMHEVEIFSKDNWWKRDPDEVLRTCVERHATAC